MESRTLKVLEAVVDEYIRTGEPVSSKALLEKANLGVSSATIRNEMSLLEAQGYLEHMHTSSGRVPTFSGYKLYIERFMPETTLSEEERLQIDKMFENIDDSTDEVVIENASRALAQLTKCAIVSTNATSKFSVITKVDVIPTGKRMYVLLLITSGGNIKNRVCRLSFDLTHEQVEFFQRFANENLKGMNVEKVSDKYFENLTTALGSYMATLSPLMKAIADLSAEMMQEKVNFEGESNLLTCKEFKGTEIALMLEQKNQLTELMDNAFSGINVMLGEEADSFVISNSSIITSTFNKGNKKAGSFGVIGPVRLDYKKIVPYIEYFTNKVTNILSADSEDDELRAIEREAHIQDEEK